MMARIAKSVRVTGRVQGVFFRVWTMEQADALGVSGWVRNCPDGSVEALLSGEEASVAEMIERMRRGPPGAKVERLAEESIEGSDSGGFAIRH